MKERKKKDGTALVAVITLGFFAFAGGMISKRMLPVLRDGSGVLLQYLIRFLLLFAAYYLQIILHEAGHLAAGLLTGYRFSSFRIGNRMLLKNSGGLSLKRYSLAGTGGQCLLIPPEKGPDGSYPYKLYHLGGVLMNLITAAVFFAAGKTCAGLAGDLLLDLALMGLLCAVTNALPTEVGGIATDGFNVLHIGGEPYGLDAMWLHLKINELQTEGIRLKDQPEEWFCIPEGASKGNVILSALAVFSENRAMDDLDLAKAEAILHDLETDPEYRILDLYRNLLQLDRITIDLVKNGKDADVSALDSPKMKKFLKQMAKYPAVVRTDYAVKLLKENDRAAADRCREAFRRLASEYPIASDIESETQIMAMLDRSAERKTGTKTVCEEGPETR